MLIALLSGSIAHATRPAVNIGLAAVFVAQSILLTAVLRRRRTPAVAWVGVLDLAVMCALQLGQILYSPVESRYSTWDAWAYGVSLSTTLMIGISLRTWRHTLVAVLAIGISYGVAVGPSAVEAGQGVTVLANAAGYLINAVVVRSVWSYLVRLGRRADSAAGLAAREERIRAEAERAESAAQEEIKRTKLKERQRVIEHLFHDQAGQFTELVGLMEATGDERLAAAARQLAQTVRTSRIVLNGDSSIMAGNTLGSVLQSVQADLTIIEVVCTTDQVDRLTLPSDVLDAIAHATRTLLLNVHHHAGCDIAVLHGSCTADQWEVMVTDNGVGFDPASTRRGYGLQRQVIEELQPHGVDVDISSVPGVGTSVTLTGNLPALKGEHDVVA
ncbi:hypothetical protein [Kribbella sp. NPDC051718]|uniref:hypothetical protein n=1 Tax=Kribbella sp. NPDC051718 TaxID=3155168 RepID=UPI00344AD518